MNHNQYTNYIESESITLKESFVYDREDDEDDEQGVKPKKVSVRKTRKTDFLDFVSK
jgi:hypothetical protein